jgi:phenylacetate-CoA ligase
MVSCWRLARPNAADLERVRNARLRRVVGHAYDRVPYYRRLFDSAGVRPEHIRTTADLALIPPTTRKVFQELPPDELTARDHGKAARITTAGSTGRVVGVLWNRHEGRTEDAIRLRGMLLQGWRPGYRTALVRSIRQPTSGHLGLLLARLGLRAARFSIRESAAEHIDALVRLRPHYLHGYASYLATIAGTCLDRGARMRPRLITTSADMLTGHFRQLIREAFGRDPLQIYSCIEVGDIAWECPQGRRLHVNSDLLWLEVLRPDGSIAATGEPGAATVTSLHHLVMPRIRYQMGDVAAMGEEPCRCGSMHPTVSELLGRECDIIKLPDGKLVTSMVFAGLFYDYLRTRAYRMVETEDGRLVLEVVSDEATSAVLEEWRRRASEFLDGQVEVEVRLVQEIPRLESGKRRLIVPRQSPPPDAEGA